jgi:hypothetical protein
MTATAAWRGASFPGEFPTLGYGVADWVEANLVQAGGSVVPITDAPADAEPIRLSTGQVTFLLWRYRLDVDGRPAYARDDQVPAEMAREVPSAAILAAAEASGPVRFAGWDERGEPVGRPVW